MHWRALIGFLVICFGVAALGGYWTEETVHGWYQTIHKSSLNPPDFVFGPVWTVLYTLMAVSAWLVWRQAPSLSLAKDAYFFFFLQLALNLAWSYFFFAKQNPLHALWDIIALNVAAWGMFLTFYSRSKWAAYLQIPYLVWIAFALFLNAQVVLLN